MPQKMNSDSIPSSDLVGAIRDAVWDSVVKVDITHEAERAAEDIDFRMQLSSFGKILMFSAQSSPVTINRTPAMAREDTEPEIFVGLQISGSSGVIQNGREASVRAGEFAIYDTTTPYSLIFDHRMDQHFFRIPRSALALPESSLRQLTAVRLGSHNPIGRFVASYLGRLAAGADLQNSEHSAAVAEPTIELLRAVLSTQLMDSTNSRPALEATLEVRIIDYMTRHLAEPDLNATRIASAHHISPRYLYVILARVGVAPSDWIRTHRLEASRHDLASAANRHETISAIAFRWGFTDSARFSRVFKTAYGLSPTEWRRLSASV